MEQVKQYICIDIGGTSIKYGVIKEDGTFVTTNEMPTEALEYGGAGIVEKMKSIIETYKADYEVAGVCVSTAGMVDCEEGKITYASPLIPNYTGTEIKKIIEETYQLPCEVENDVNCAGLAEYYAGSAKGSSSSLCLTIGTGIGGSIVLNGNVWHGFSGSGCEVGYMHMPNGEFQDLGASSILVKKVAKWKQVDQNSIDGKYVFEQAKNGDEDCIRAIDEMVDVLGMGIANICYVLNPEVIVLGGGIMAQKDYLYEKIQASLHKYLLPSIAEKTKLTFAQNQNQAGMLGAFYHFKSRN